MPRYKLKGFAIKVGHQSRLKFHKGDPDHIRDGVTSLDRIDMGFDPMPGDRMLDASDRMGRLGPFALAFPQPLAIIEADGGGKS